MRIPTYLSKTAPAVVDRGSASRDEYGFPAAAGAYRLSSAVTDASLEAEKRVGDAARLADFVSKKDLFTERIGTLNDELAQDPDHKTYFSRAKKGMEEISREVLSGVNDPELKNTLTLHVGNERQRYMLDARHKARELAVDYSRNTMKGSIEKNVRDASATTDVESFSRAIGDIEAAVTGAVKGGIWTSEQGGELVRGARKEIYTAQALRMADEEPGRFLENYREGRYQEHVDPDRLEQIRRHAESKVPALQGYSAASEVWEKLGPQSDTDPVNVDRMVEELMNRFPNDPDKARVAIGTVRELVSAHEKGVQERRDANLSAVWKDALSGKMMAQIMFSSNYSTLDGNSQRIVKEHLEDRSWMMRGRETEEKKGARHELYWRYSQPEVLEEMSESAVSALYPFLGVELTDRLMEKRRSFDNPAKLPEAKTDSDDFNHFARQAGMEPLDRKYAPRLGEIRYHVENRIEQEQRRLKRALSREEKAKIIKGSFLEVDVKAVGWFGKTIDRKKAGEVQWMENIVIPPAVRERIEADLRSLGVPPTDEKIAEAYLRLRE